MAAEQPPCLQGDEPFTAARIIGTAGGSNDDARRLDEARLSTFRRAESDAVACERLLIAFSTEAGAPATVLGLTGAEAITDAAVVRLSFGNRIAETAISDILFEGELASRIFVVREPAGDLYLDVHLAGPVAARLTEFRSPARLALDLQPIAAAGKPVPLVGDSVVLVSPRSDAPGYPLRLFGYARGRQRNIPVELIGPDQTVSGTIAPIDYPWGEFTVDFPAGPTGQVILRIGEFETNLRIG